MYASAKWLVDLHDTEMSLQLKERVKFLSIEALSTDKGIYQSKTDCAHCDAHAGHAPAHPSLPPMLPPSSSSTVRSTSSVHPGRMAHVPT